MEETRLTQRYMQHVGFNVEMKGTCFLNDSNADFTGRGNKAVPYLSHVFDV
jgi:hypothetical protein